MIDPPEPLKRGFGHPVTPDCLEYFVHPGGEAHFEQPFVFNGKVHACNRWLAVRFDTLDPAGVAEVPDAIERMALIPWDRLDKLSDDSTRWSSLDDAPLFRFGPRPIWERSRSLYHPRLIPAVAVGADAVAPLAMVQLLSRLPRARVWTDNHRSGPLLCRFNGGSAVIAPFPDYTEHRLLPDFHILRPRKDLWTGLSEWAEKPLARPRWLPGHGPKPTAPADIHHDDLPVIIHD